jgi:hypothetical protein
VSCATHCAARIKSLVPLSIPSFALMRWRCVSTVFGGQVQRPRDLTGGLAAPHELEHLELAIGEQLDAAVRARAAAARHPAQDPLRHVRRHVDLAFGQRADRDQQVLARLGLADEASRSRAQRARRVQLGVVDRKHDRFHTREARADLGQEIEAARIVQGQVDDRDVRRGGLEHLQGPGVAFCLTDHLHVGHRGDQLREPAADDRVVVDDHHPGPVLGRRLERGVTELQDSFRHMFFPARCPDRPSG